MEHKVHGRQREMSPNPSITEVKDGRGAWPCAPTLAAASGNAGRQAVPRRRRGYRRIRDARLAFTLYPLHFNLLKLAIRFFSKEQTLETVCAPLLYLGFLAMRIFTDADERPRAVSEFVAASSRAIPIPHGRKRPY